MEITEAIKAVQTRIEEEKPIPKELIELIAEEPYIDIPSGSMEDVFRYLINEDIEITEELLQQFISVDGYFNEFSGDRSGEKFIDPDFKKWLIDREFNGDIDIDEWIGQRKDDLHEYEDLYMEYLSTEGRCIYLSGLSPWNVYAPVNPDDYKRD